MIDILSLTPGQEVYVVPVNPMRAKYPVRRLTFVHYQSNFCYCKSRSEYMVFNQPGLRAKAGFRNEMGIWEEWPTPEDKTGGWSAYGERRVASRMFATEAEAREAVDEFTRNALAKATAAADRANARLARLTAT